MKLCIALLFAAVLATNAEAGLKKAIKNFGHELKQTGVDFVTFRHPAWSLMVLAEIGADLADAKTTDDCQHYVPRCTERNAFLYGQHPHFGRVAGTDLGISILPIVTSHWAHTHTRRPYIKTADYWWLIPQTIDIVALTHAAYVNATIPRPPAVAPPPRSDLRELYR